MAARDGRAAGAGELRVGHAQSQDPNFVIYIPLNTFQYRFFDTGGNFKDELDGVDIRLKLGADSVSAAKVVTAILEFDASQDRRFLGHDSGRTAGANSSGRNRSSLT